MQNKWKYILLELLKIILYIILAVLTVIAGKEYMKQDEIVEYNDSEYSPIADEK